MISRREVATVAGSAAAIAVITALFIYIAIAARKAEYLCRGGATILALTALFVVWQITREAELDAALEHVHEAGQKSPVPALSEPSVVRRMKALARSQVRLDVKNVRMIYVWLVAIATAFGEFLHGWGDLVLTALGIVPQR
jgi:hypothetical protein